MAKRSTHSTPPAVTAWQMTIPCSRKTADQFQLDAELLFVDWPAPPAILASEPNEAQPDEWQLDIIFEGEPEKSAIAYIRSLLPDGETSPYELGPVPEMDWVTQSQAGLDPITAGPFHVSNDPGDAPRPGFTNFIIPASQAFGTGQHETTHGCLLKLANLHSHGYRFGNIADIGTGTGLLAFAARSLWPHAHVLASDIDPVAVEVSAENAVLNDVPLGGGAGEIQLVAAAGIEHPLIIGLAPYDLIIANILAGPLIELAPALSAQLAEGGSLILAGLLDTQAERVKAAYRAQGLLLMSQNGDGEWPALHLRKRHRFGWRRPPRWRAGDVGEAPGFGSL